MERHRALVTYSRKKLLSLQNLATPYSHLSGWNTTLVDGAPARGMLQHRHPETRVTKRRRRGNRAGWRVRAKKQILAMNLSSTIDKNVMISLLKMNQKSGLSIGHWNINSVFHKTDSFLPLLQNSLLDVFCLSESKLCNTDSSALFQVIGREYNIHRRDRNRHGGGLLAYVREDLHPRRRKAFESSGHEIMCLEINLARRKLCIIFAYRPPSTSQSEFLEGLFSTLDLVRAARMDFLIIGDLNMDLARPVDVGKQLVNFISDQNLTSLISEPTRLISRSVIDVILASEPNLHQNVAVIPRAESDHSMVCVSVKSKMPRPPSRKITYRSLKKVDPVMLIADLNNIHWDEVTSKSDPSGSVNQFETEIIGILDNHCPTKFRFVKPDQPAWVTPRLIKCAANRNRLFRQFTANKTPETKARYIESKKIASKVRRSEIRSTINKVIADSSPQDFWKTINPWLPSKKRLRSQIFLTEKSKVIVDPTSVATILNDHFTSFMSNSNTLSAHQTNYISDMKRKVTVPSAKFKFQHVTPAEVTSILRQLKTRKSPGMDGIPNWILSIGQHALAHPLSDLFNAIIDKETYPVHWKDGLVSPIFKREDPSSKTNYRPITLLKSLSKVFERLLDSQIHEFMKEHNLWSDTLSGFLRGNSCESALLKITEDWRKALDLNHTVAVTAFDLSRAFDTVHHELLLSKLSAYGFEKSSVSLLQSYLCNRRQKVRIDGHLSDWRSTPTGVPQGSILGPTLFNILSNDLRHSLTYCSVRQYADDTTIYHHHNDISRLESEMNEDIRSLCNWFTLNCLTLNQKKTGSLFLGTGNPNLQIEGSPINKQQQIKLLGVELDSKLTFGDFVSSTCRKVMAKSSALSRMRNFFSANTKVRLFKTMIMPHFHYCNILLLAITGSLQSRLDKCFCRALQGCVGKAYSKFLGGAFKVIGTDIATLRQQSLESAMQLCWDVRHGGAPCYLSNEFRLAQGRTRAASRKDFVLRKCKKQVGSNSSCIVAAAVYNKVAITHPEALSECQRSEFMSRVRKMDLTKFL